MGGERVERRLAAVLAADIVAYSRLMGQDEVGTLSRLRALRRELIGPNIAEHHGRVVKTMGDGFLAEFSSSVDALRCACDIQARVPEYNMGAPPDLQIGLRIGIHQGDVVVEDSDIFGDGVNIAARLEAMAEPGGICVSARVQEDATGKLDLAFRDLGDQQLKNIVRTVRAYAIELTTFRPQNSSALPVRRLSIVVLPFANLSSDPEQEYFADGITEDLTTDLSRIPEMVVISRNTAFTYRRKTVDTRQIGRELSVRYVLEGSVRRLGSQVRINAQLIEAHTDTHLWAERFDGAVEGLFALQDEIVARLASQLGAQLIEAEARRAEHSPDPDSMDLYFRAKALMNRGSTAEYLKPAEALLERALQLDSNNVDALAAKGWVNMDLGAGFMADDRRARLATVEASATKALSLAPDHAFAHLVLGSFYSAVDRSDEAIAEFEHALILDRNLVYAHALIGMAKTALGRAEEAENHYRQALRISPRDVSAHHWMSSAGTSKLHLARDEEAVLWFRRAIEANRNFAFTHLSLAAALAHLGKMGEAHAAAKAGLDLEPSFSIARFRAGARSENPVYLGGRERIYEGMRRAGIPE